MQAAIDQIKRKEYMLKFQEKLAGKRIHTGRILAVGIGYDKKTKDIPAWWRYCWRNTQGCFHEKEGSVK